MPIFPLTSPFRSPIVGGISRVSYTINAPLPAKGFQYISQEAKCGVDIVLHFSCSEYCSRMFDPLSDFWVLLLLPSFGRRVTCIYDSSGWANVSQCRRVYCTHSYRYEAKAVGRIYIVRVRRIPGNKLVTDGRHCKGRL